MWHIAFLAATIGDCMSYSGSSETSALGASNSDPGAIPGTSILVVQSVSFGTVVDGGGNGNAPGVNVSISIEPVLLSQIASVTVRLNAPDGEVLSQSADADDGDDLQNLFVGLRSQSISGEYSISQISIQFKGDPAVTGFPENGLVLVADEISSLATTRFIDFVNPDEDITPPEVTDILLPTRSILVDNDLPLRLGGGNSAEITFQATITDDKSGLNVIEFEFDVGPGDPAVIGAEVGIFGDLDEGSQQLSAFNTESPAGNYIFELLRVSDDQGNTVLYTADDLAGLGFQNSIQVVTQQALQDATSPTVTSLSLSSNDVTVGPSGGSLTVSLNASDSGFGATGVQSVTIVLISELGSRYQLEASVSFGVNNDGTAIFQFARDFPAGNFAIERLSVNDGAFNRQDIDLDDASITVVNPEAGDISGNRLRGDDKDNVIVARAGNDTVIGGLGDDNLVLGGGDDVSFAGAGDTGNDTVEGGSGNDLIAAAAGDDLIVGGQIITVEGQTLLLRSLETRLDGSDTVFGGDGDDTIFGGSPRFSTDDLDQVTVEDLGSVAPDLLFAGEGDDLVQASFGDDTVGGGRGNDTLRGGSGDDLFFGGSGDGDTAGRNDVIYGENGNDVIFAAGGNDSILGGADNDSIFGGVGDDTLDGEGGHDELSGGTGNDVLAGGGGRDTFFFRPGSGSDVITDYDGSEDTIFLSQYSSRFSSTAELLVNSSVAVVDGESGLLIDLGEGDQIFVQGVSSFFELTITF